MNKDIVLYSIYTAFLMISLVIYMVASEKFSKDIIGYELFLIVVSFLAVICLYKGAKAVIVDTDKMYTSALLVNAFSLFTAFFLFLLIFRVFSCSNCM